MEFTPKQLHYFKRELVIEELNKEIDKLVNIPDIAPIIDNTSQDFPFLCYIFHNIIIEFPLLKHTCTDEFWPKIKVFFNEFNKAQLATFYTPRHSESNLQRKLIQHKIEKSLVFAFCASIKTTQGQEESVHIQPDDLNLQKETQQTTQPTAHLHVNIVSVREIKEKRTLRDVSHPEFLIESIFEEPIYVARHHDDFKRLREELLRNLKNKPVIPLVPLPSANNQPFYGEHDRLLLRGWLCQLIGNSSKPTNKLQHQIQNSVALKKFLTDNPIVFTPEDEEDADMRETADKERELEQQRYQKELDKRVYELNDTLQLLKKDILQPGGLIRIFDIIKSTKDINDLPLPLKKTFEWGRINFAFALHRNFLTSVTASENVDKLRLTHNLMPYRTLALFLRFSNPIAIVKALLDLFLAQPFGGNSLLQRLILSNMNEESKSFSKQIQILEEVIDDKIICEKVYNAVKTPLPDNSDFRKYKTKTLEIFAILNNHDIKPMLSLEQMELISKYSDDNPQAKQLIKHLVQLWELYTKQYEQELLMDLVFQGLTGELLKEFIAVFYQPLAQVYKAADISTTIYHVSSFIDDLVQLIDRLQKEQKEHDMKFNSIQSFIDLVQRHEQHFYDFVHNVHSQEVSTVFDELIQYLDKLFTFVTDGIPGKLDLNECIRQAGIESQDELDVLKQEIDALCNYRYQQRLYQFERQKRRLMMHESEVFQFIPKRSEIVNALNEFNDDDDGHSTSSVSSGSHLSHKGIEEPELNLIPTILPHFIKQVVKMMNA